MAYTATKFLSPRALAFPGGFDNTQKLVTVRGTMVENDTATFYSTGGVGSSSFQVTAFSAVGLVTYNTFVGMPLYNGQLVVVFGTTHNDGTYTVANVAATTTVAGTFTAVPLAGNTLNGTGDTAQTAEGVGQVQWGVRQFLPQTFTAATVTVSGGIMTVTYTTLTGPQLQPGDNVTLVGMTNAGNNGTFSLNTVTPTSSTAGSFTVTNANAVASDNGTGTGKFKSGIEAVYTADPPIEVQFFSNKGYNYCWNYVNQTVQIFVNGAGSGTISAPTITTLTNATTTSPVYVNGSALTETTGATGITGVQAPTFTGTGGGALAEAALGASVAFDGTIHFRASFIRAQD